MHNLCMAHTHTHTYTLHCSCQKKRKCRGKIITATFHTLHIKFGRRRAALRIDELVFLGHSPYPTSSFCLLPPRTCSTNVCVILLGICCLPPLQSQSLPRLIQMFAWSLFRLRAQVERGWQDKQMKKNTFEPFLGLGIYDHHQGRLHTHTHT